MSDKRQYHIILAGLILTMFGLTFIFVRFASEQGEVFTDALGESIILTEYSNRIIYDPTVFAEFEPYENDCREKGGEFNRCGEPCDSAAEECLPVCALTCTFDEIAETVADEA